MDKHSSLTTRPVGRPCKGKKKRVRASFTLSPEAVSWLSACAHGLRVSKSEAIESALQYYQKLCGEEGSPLKGLCAKYPAIFWDINPADVDDKKHSAYVIERILEHGSLASVRDLLLLFPAQRIANVVKNSRRISRKTALFWTAHLGIKEGVRCLSKEFLNPLSRPWEN